MASNALRAVIGHALRDTGAKLKEGSEMVEFFTRHRHIIPWNGIAPFVTNDTFIAPTATVIGEVTNWDESSIWYGAVVRADQKHPITIGFSSSIGEGSVVITLPEKATLESGFPPVCHVGHYVTVGAGCVLQSCTIDDLVIIGEKCTIMEGSIIESKSIIEPGTMVPPYSCIPSGQRWGGNPARFISVLKPSELDTIKPMAEKQHILAWEHLTEFLPVGNTYVHLEELERKGTKTAQG